MLGYLRTIRLDPLGAHVILSGVPRFFSSRGVCARGTQSKDLSSM
jgi:hypothetical protein